MKINMTTRDTRFYTPRQPMKLGDMMIVPGDRVNVVRLKKKLLHDGTGEKFAYYAKAECDSKGVFYQKKHIRRDFTTARPDMPFPFSKRSVFITLVLWALPKIIEKNIENMKEEQRIQDGYYGDNQGMTDWDLYLKNEREKWLKTVKGVKGEPNDE